VRAFSYSQRDLTVLFGDGALGRFPVALDEMWTRIEPKHRTSDEAGEAERVLLISTPGRASLAESARASLGQRVACVFTGARPHVPSAVVSAALDRARAVETRCVVAIGGGSAIGLGKAVVRELAVPLVAVPTTYAGSEMTDIWGVTDAHGKKTGRDPDVAPRLVVYDPQLTSTMPPEVARASGVNAIAHSVEALYAPDASPTSNLFAAEGIRRLASSLPRLAVGSLDPSAAAAGRDALYGAHLCARALDMTSMGLHHKLCHALAGAAGLPHAKTHAAVLPYVTAYNATADPEAMATIASTLGTQNAPKGLWELNRSLGITQTLADLGLQPEDADRVIEDVTSRPYPNPASVTPEGVRELLARAMSGDPP
jgi:maleylacetate reductase